MYFEDHSGTALNWSECENFILALKGGSEGETDGMLEKSCSSMSWPNGSMLMLLSLIGLRGEELPVNLSTSLYRDSVKKASLGVRAWPVCKLREYPSDQTRCQDPEKVQNHESRSWLENTADNWPPPRFSVLHFFARCSLLSVCVLFT